MGAWQCLAQTPFMTSPGLGKEHLFNDNEVLNYTEEDILNM